MSWLSEQFKKSKRKGTGIYSWAGGGKATTALASVASVVPGVGTALGATIGSALALLVDGSSGNPKKNKDASQAHIAHMLGQQFANKSDQGITNLFIYDNQ